MKLSKISYNTYKSLKEEGFNFDYSNLKSPPGNFYSHSNYTLNGNYKQKYDIIIRTNRTGSSGGYIITITYNTCNLFLLRCSSLNLLKILLMEFKKIENKFFSCVEITKCNILTSHRKKYIVYYCSDKSIVIFRKNGYSIPSFISLIYNEDNILNIIKSDVLIQKFL